MANIATCPKCAKQLGLPASIETTDRAECPECRAIFSLSETVQISLPVVRVLDPAEQPVAAVSLSDDEQTPTVKKNVSETLASNTAPLKSWEERLKNALALDGSDDAATSKNDASVVPLATASAETTSSRSPNFEFELEPTPSADAEPKQERTPLELPKSTPLATPKALSKPAAKRTSSLSKTLAEFAPGKLTSAGGALAGPTAKIAKAKIPGVEVAEQVERAATEAAGVAVQTFARRPVTRRWFPKVAALATGPVLGGLLGFYGLLWWGGAKADFVGLARVLPSSLLPDNFGESTAQGTRGAAPLAEASSQGFMAKLQKSPPAMKHDGEVRPASAARPVSPVVSAARISAGEFMMLVDAAEVALPEFMAGDLSTSGTIKRKGQAYMALCRLAEHFDFAQQRGLAPATQAEARQAEQLFQRIASQANLRQDLARIAGRWWEYDKRPSAGIFLAGEVQEAESAGGGTLCFVKLGEQSSVPVILVWFKNAQYQNGEQIGVVGRIITEPSELPPGVSYGQVVQAEYSFALESSR